MGEWLWVLQDWGKSLDKRYQVFISSTFLDLQEERRAVSRALLRSDCFPAQMENWPAMDAEQMEAIKQIIDESDYFLVISAGKYGSINPETGLSYTEMEYDYAMLIGKPIIRLLHRDPPALTGKQLESKAGVRRKLEAFHEKLKSGAVCSFWENADQLEKETVFALVDVKKRKPSTGWVPGNMAMTMEVSKELNRLRLSEKSTKKGSSETVIDFNGLKGEAIADIKVQADDLEADEETHSSISIPNKIVAESVFLALLELSRLDEISYEASNIATRALSFPPVVQEMDHYWAEFRYPTVKNCLLYLETRALVNYHKGTSSFIPDEWRITAKGRAHAAFIKASQEFY